MAKRDSEYKRCGTANVFCAVESKAGRHFTWPTPDRSADQFAMAMFEIAMSYRDADTIHLVMDRRIHLTTLSLDFGAHCWFANAHWGQIIQTWLRP